MPWHYPGYQRVDSEAAARKFEQAWNVESGGLNRNLGLTTTEIMNEVGLGGVRALHIMGENPMMSEPNLNHTRHMIEQLEFLSAQDLFINESGAYADVFLPAASWAEKEGTFTSTDRRVQRVRKAIEPRGQARADWQINCELALRIEQKLGRSQTAFWDYRSPAEVLAEMGRVVPEYAGVKYARIEKEGLQTPVWDDNHPGTPYLFADSFPRGKGKFFDLEYIPSVELPDEEYPLILTTGRLLEHWHGGTLTRHSQLDDLFPQARVEINPADATRLKLEDGQTVRVTSRRGTVVLRAWVTQRTTVGVVFIPMHFHEAAANLLTIDAIDPLAKIPEYKACAVRVDLAGQEELPPAPQRGRY
jgi:predicted molibdopterin-dependent oxidoreductase YjgC